MKITSGGYCIFNPNHNSRSQATRFVAEIAASAEMLFVLGQEKMVNGKFITKMKGCAKERGSLRIVRIGDRSVVLFRKQLGHLHRQSLMSLSSAA